jgi:hypothetical protein
MMQRTKAIPVVLIMLAVMMMNWGVAYERSQLDLYSGDSYQFYTSIQNMESTAKNVTVRLSGDNIAKIDNAEEFYILQPQTKIPIYINITIPENPKETYMVRATYTASPTTSGISIATQKTVTINIRVIDFANPSSGSGGSGSSGNSQNQQNVTINSNQTQIINQTTETQINQTEATISGTGIGIGVKISDPIMGYVVLAIVIGAISIGGYMVWKKGIIDEIRDMTGL